MHLEYVFRDDLLTAHGNSLKRGIGEQPMEERSELKVHYVTLIGNKVFSTVQIRHFGCRIMSCRTPEFMSSLHSVLWNSF